MKKRLQLARVASPIGALLLVYDEGIICALDYGEYQGRMTRLLSRRYGDYTLEPQQNEDRYTTGLAAYFAGDLSALDTLPVRSNGTAFQQQIWQTLRTIPPGSTLSYGHLAARIGRPTAARAVGMTNALNPIAIIVPCHRVVGADGSLTGYAGGLARKAWLLHHESDM